MPTVEHHDLLDYAEQGSTPSTPAAGFGRWYVKTADHRFYWKDSTGVEYKAMADPLTTAGDLPYGGAAGVETRLALGAVGARLEAGASAPQWQGPQSVRAFNSTGQNVLTGTATPLALDSERWDTAAMHDPVTNNSRLTAPVAGHYIISGHAAWPTNTTGQRILQIRVNGTTVIAATDVPTSAAASAPQQTVTALYQLAAADYVELIAFQDSGGTLVVPATANYSAEFGMGRFA